MLIDSIRCELYNASYEPLAPVTARRAINLILKGKATALETHESVCIHSEGKAHALPIRIVMNYMVKGMRAAGPAVLTQRNLFTRDGHTCQYCLRHKSELGPGEILTRDHVHPKDLGGTDAWDNVVTSCVKCNNRKANIPLHQTGMTLHRKPFAPSRFEIWNRNAKHRKINMA